MAYQSRGGHKTFFPSSNTFWLFQLAVFLAVGSVNKNDRPDPVLLNNYFFLPWHLFFAKYIAVSLFEEWSRRIKLWEIWQLQFFWFSFSARFSPAARFWRKGPIRIHFLYRQPPTRNYLEKTASWILTSLSAILFGKKGWKNGTKAIVQFPKACRASLSSSIISILHQEVTGRLTEVSGRLATTEPDTSGAAGPIAEEDQEDKQHPPLLRQPASCSCFWLWFPKFLKNYCDSGFRNGGCI